MRLLKKQPGLPFLLALGVLLILSASFLAVQFWSGNNVFRGAAEALEAPLLPPSMKTGQKGRSRAALDKKNEKVKTAAVVEVVTAPEVQEEKTASVEKEPVSLSKASAPTMMEAPSLPPTLPTKTSRGKAKAAKTGKAAAALKPASVKPVEVAPAPVKAAAVADVQTIKKQVGEESSSSVAGSVKPQASPVVEIGAPIHISAEAEVAQKPLPAEKPMAVLAKTSVKRIGAVKKADETVVPPEWNWFNTPLKIEISNGRVEIISENPPRELVFESVVVRLPDNFGSVAEDAQYESAARIEAPAEKPFIKALARMAKLRYSRLAAVKEDPQLAQAVAKQKCETLEQLREAVVMLCGKLDKSEKASADQALAGSTVEVALPNEIEPVIVDEAPINSESKSLVVDVPGVDEADAVEYEFAPYYSGSGTGLSSRINDLLSNGVGYSRK